jgi:Raf kinase inhibitor-like YbhB/YbcL family protein
MAIRGRWMALLGLAVLAGWGCTRTSNESVSAPSSALAAGKPLAITMVRSKGGTIVVSSPVFADGGPIPDIYTAFGKGVPPPVMWTPVSGAKSYAVVMEDPDAPGQAPHVHWIVYDIPMTASALDDQSQGGTLPTGAKQGRTTSGVTGYEPPNPPAGDKGHRYFVEVFALDTSPQLSGAPDLGALERAMAGHVLADGETIGVYQASPPQPGAAAPAAGASKRAG